MKDTLAKLGVKPEDITFQYGYSEHIMFFRGVRLGGAGTLHPARRTKDNLAFHKEQAEIKKRDILAGRMYFERVKELAEQRGRD